MSRILVVALVMLFVLPGPLTAATLEATSGSVLIGTVGFTLDPSINLSGDGWSLSSVGPFPSVGSPTTEQAPLFAPTLVVEGVEYAWSDVFPRFPGDNAIFGSVSMFHQPAPTALSLFAEAFETPFIMIGHVALGDGFDLVGQGILTTGPAVWDPRFVQRTYTFTASEPSPLPLVFVGIIGAGIIVARGRSRGRHTS